MSFSIAGRTALVTGANRGIGEAIVDALIAAGAKKVYVAARNDSDAAPVVKRHGNRAVSLQLDVTSPAHIEAAAAAASDVQLLVNNAGFAGKIGGAFTDPQWLTAARREMDVNYFGTFSLTQSFAPVLARNGGGAIVNIASVASLTNFPVLLSYSVSKAATHSLTQGMRMLLAAQGTQVFGVYPGPIETRMAEGLELDKTSPAECARAIVKGIEDGTVDIFPDAMSRTLGTAYFADPKAVERQITEMVSGTPG